MTLEQQLAILQSERQLATLQSERQSIQDLVEGLREKSLALFDQIQSIKDQIADRLNYIEMRFHNEATGPLLLTLQRVNGKTPHQLRTEAEKERDILRAKVAAEI